MSELKRKGRGFASMDPEKLRAVSSMGGKAAQAKGNCHRFTRDEAVEAGKKGGQKAFENRVLREAEARDFNPNKPIPSGVGE